MMLRHLLSGTVRRAAQWPQCHAVRSFAVGLPSEIRRKTVVSANGSPKSEVGKVDYPALKGASEIHIFLAPINPGTGIVEKYNSAVADWNAKYWDDEKTRKAGASTQMRPVYLCLDFRSLGPTFVCQSARHIVSDSPEAVVQEALQDAEHFESHGFDVIRRKVEAYGYTKGVPVTDEEAASFPDKYFEFHLRVNRRGDAPSEKISEQEIAQLLALSRQYTERWGVPVPLSYNAYKEGRQRFLNLRVGHCGRETALKSISQIKNDIASDPNLKYLEVGSCKAS